MPILDDFAAEFDTEPTPDDEEAATQQAISQVLQDSLDDEEIDEELREAEKRLSKAAYYKVIVKSGVIEDDGTPEATEINSEARLWARKSMVALLGGKERIQPLAPIQEPQFNEKEVSALKKLAEKILSANLEKPVDPVVKKVPTAPAPVAKKIQSVKPQPRKVESRVAPKAQQAKQQPQAQAKKPGRPKKDSDGNIDYESMERNVPFTDTDGQVYKIVDNPNFRGDLGTRSWTRLKVTNQVKNPASIPMPSGSGMEAMMAQKSAESVNNIQAANKDSITANRLITAAALSMKD